MAPGVEEPDSRDIHDARTGIGYGSVAARLRPSLIDEIPGAYQDIDEVVEPGLCTQPTLPALVPLG